MINNRSIWIEKFLTNTDKKSLKYGRGLSNIIRFDRCFTQKTPRKALRSIKWKFDLTFVMNVFKNNYDIR